MPAWATNVRTDAVTRLIAAGTTAGSRVEDTRLHAIHSGLSDGTVSAETTPRLIVETGEVRRASRGHGKGTVTETVTLSVTGVIVPAQATTDAALGAALDTLEEDAHDALMQDGEWIRLYLNVVPMPTKRLVEIAESGSRIASFSQTYEITANRTRQAPSPETRDALETVTVDLQLNNDTVAEVTLAGLEA